MVCGTDGKLYASKCQLKLFVCQIQSVIDVQDMHFCIGEYIYISVNFFRSIVTIELLYTACVCSAFIYLGTVPNVFHLIYFLKL